jgi:uncharacterized membrane protein HdeD (DUF308 family)
MKDYIKQIVKALYNLIQQRRFWASLFAFLAVLTPALGISFDVDVNSLTEKIMVIVGAFSSLMAIILPVWSLYSPKQK